MVGYLQQLGNYYRVRHYIGINSETRKSQFKYCQQSKEWISSKTNFKNETALNLAESKALGQSSVLDLKLKDSSSDIQSEACLRSLARWGVTLVR